jgi:hypothetical protein
LKRIDSSGRPSLVPWTYEEVVAKYSGAKRLKYELAAQSLLDDPWRREDSYVQAFTKGEKLETTKKLSDPRIIQFRPPRHILSLAAYLEPVDQGLYALKSSGRHGMRHRTRLIAKGLNQRQRADAIRSKWSEFSDPVCFSIDASRFDLHVHRKVLEQVEHMVYLRLYRGDTSLASLLGSQLVNRVRSSQGLRYTVQGNRMSGDKNTATGNCLLALVMALAAMRRLRIRKFDTFVDGDDVLLFVERAQETLVRERLAAEYLTFGQEIKVEGIAYRLSDITHCQCRLTLTSGGDWIMVRPWKKVLSSSLVSTRHFASPKSAEVIRSIAQCELALNSGVPILQAFSVSVLNRIGSGATSKVGRYAYAFVTSKWQDVKAIPITPAARVAFALTWGVSPEEQILIERELLDGPPFTWPLRKEPPLFDGPEDIIRDIEF